MSNYKKIDAYVYLGWGNCLLPNAQIIIKNAVNGAILRTYKTDNRGHAKIDVPTDVPASAYVSHRCIKPSDQFIGHDEIQKGLKKFKMLGNGQCDNNDCAQNNQQNTGAGNADVPDLDPFNLGTDESDIHSEPGSHSGGQQNTGAGTGTGTGSGAGQGQGTGNNTGTGGTRPPGTGGVKPPKRTIMKFQIIDQKTKNPLPGAEVYNHNTNQGAITDIDGYVSIAAKAGDIIEIRFMGYQTQKLPAEQVPKVVEMAESAETLDTVTITLPKRRRRLFWVLVGSLGLYLLFGRNEKGMNGPDEPVEVDL